MRALQRPAGDGRCERRADFAIQVLALRLEGLQCCQFVVIRPGRVIGDEVQIQEVIRRGVEVLRMRIACVELAERDALVAADVLDAQLAALLPDRVSELLVVEPPALLGGRVEGVELEARNLVLLDVLRQTIQRHAQALVRREPAGQHQRGLRPVVAHPDLVLHRDHVLPAVMLAEAERVEDADRGVTFLQDQLAVVLDVHVARAVRQAECLAEIVEQAARTTCRAPSCSRRVDNGPAGYRRAYERRR